MVLFDLDSRCRDVGMDMELESNASERSGRRLREWWRQIMTAERRRFAMCEMRAKEVGDKRKGEVVEVAYEEVAVRALPTT